MQKPAGVVNKPHPFSFSLAIFTLFLAGTMAVGRAFSLINIPGPLFPIYITEIVLIVLSPFILTNYSVVKKWPPFFRNIVKLFFFFSLSHLIFALFKGNLYAVRDIVFNVYVTFIVLGFIFLPRFFSSKTILLFLVFVNFIGLILARCIFTGISMPYEEEILEYISGNKATHIGLTCGIFLSFYLSSFFYIQNRLKRGLIFILMFFNFYTIIIAGERSLWVALFFMLLVSCFIGEKRFLKFKVVVIMTLAVFTLAEWLYLDKALHGTDRMRLINLKMAYLLHYDQKNAINNMPEIVPEKTLVSTENDGDLKSNNEEESRDVFKLVETEEDKNNLNIIITSYRWRIDIIRQAFLYGLGSPIIGQGFGKYPDYYIFNQPVKLKTNSPAADSGGVPSHNHLITVFYKMGIIGLLLFLMLNWFVLKGGMKVLPVLQGERWILEGLLSAMIFWHTLALFFDIIDSPTTNIFLWVMIGGILFFLVPRQQIMERNSA